MDKNRLHVLFIPSWYANRLDPYLGNFVRKHAEAVARHADVSVLHVCSDPGMNDKTFEIVTAKEPGIFTVNVYYKKIRNKIPLVSQFSKFSRYMKAHRMGLEVIRRNNAAIDIIHGHVLWPAGLFVQKLSEETGIPYLLTEHSTAYLPSRAYERSGFEKKYSRSIAAKAGLITPVSKDLQKAMVAAGLKGKYDIIYNVVDTKLFHPAETGKNEKVRFLHISTMLDTHKNISGMLRVIAKLSKTRSDFEVHFVTDGDARPHMETARQLGLGKDTVSFGGKMTTEEVASVMRTSDCFVMFSNYENLPCVLIEAFASGLPVISTGVGGVPEHVDAKKGMLVKSGDENGLFDAMNKMIGDIRSGKFSKNELFAYADDHFSYEKVGERFLELYKKILGQ